MGANNGKHGTSQRIPDEDPAVALYLVWKRLSKTMVVLAKFALLYWSDTPADSRRDLVVEATAENTEHPVQCCVFQKRSMYLDRPLEDVDASIETWKPW